MPLLLLLACDRHIGDVSVVSGVGTWAQFRWTAAEEGAGRVRWGADLEHTLDAGDGLKHSVWLVGAEPGTTWQWVAESQGVDGAWIEEGRGEVQAPFPPSRFPTLTGEGEPAVGGWLVEPMFGNPQGAAIFSVEGWPTWWVSDTEKGPAITDAQLSPDGTTLRYLQFTPNVPDPDAAATALGRLVETNLRSGGQTTIDLPGAHHAFAQLPDGTLAWLANDFRQLEGTWVRGDQLVERSPDGVETTLWSAWDSFTWSADDPVDGTGWTHCNALTYDADTDTYVVSVRNQSTILDISRGGEVVWRFGGAESDFALGSRPFVHQHRARLADDGATLLVFDNGETSSRVVVYALDLEVGTATETRTVEPGRWAYSLGDVTRLDGDELLVTWGTTGVISQESAAGADWTLSADLGSGFGFGQYIAPGGIGD